jgi:hypothetical protein
MFLISSDTIQTIISPVFDNQEEVYASILELIDTAKEILQVTKA